MSLRIILSSILAVAIISASGITVLAADKTRPARSGETRPGWSQRRGGYFEELLEAGVVSQSTYEKMRAYFEKNPQPKPDRPERWNMLDNLLEAKIITQAEHDALKAAMANPPARPEGLDKSQQANPYARFVADGLISQETADKIMEYFVANRPQKTQRTDIFSKMLEDGIITQAEYDDIKAAMPERAEKTAKASKALAS